MLEITRAPAGTGHLPTCALLRRLVCRLQPAAPGPPRALQFLGLQTALRSPHLLCWSQGRDDHGPSKQAPTCQESFPLRRKGYTHREANPRGWAKRLFTEHPRHRNARDMRRWSEEGQLFSHKAIPAVASPSRAHGKMVVRGPCLLSQRKTGYMWGA